VSRPAERVAAAPRAGSHPAALPPPRGSGQAHGLFLVALLLGACIRVVVQIAFPPAFVFSDGPRYLNMVDKLTPAPDRPVGYGGFLRALSWLTRDVSAVAITQHVLGLLTAVVIYVLLRHRGVSGRVATLATLPVLFDGMELVLEHSVLSDVLFDLLVVLAVAVLAWRPSPQPANAAYAGLLLGLAVLIRLVGEPMIVPAIVFCLLASKTVSARLGTALVLCLTFVLPLVVYAGWYASAHGTWALSQAGGRALYMRTTSFVDCSVVEVPAYERHLCPADPVGQRKDPTYYGWHDPRTLPALNPPPGISRDEALHDFAVSAIRGQPWDYLRISARDFLMTFALQRKDFYGYDTAYKWSFHHYVDYLPTPYTGPAYAGHGGQQPHTRHPLADFLDGYGHVVYVPGPLLLATLLLALAGLVWRRPRGAPPTRALIFLTTSLGVGLLLAPDLTAEFTWRYELPALVLVPIGAALAWTRIRSSGQPGTTATPSTD
jgi:hypothetical protein